VTIDEAKKFIGREASFSKITGKIVNVRKLPFSDIIVAFLDDESVVNIEILKIKEEPKTIIEETK
jgi:hypothetical protein